MAEDIKGLGLELNAQGHWIPALEGFAWRNRYMLLFEKERRMLHEDAEMADVHCLKDCPEQVQHLLRSRAIAWMEKHKTTHYDDMTTEEQQTWALDMFRKELERKNRKEEKDHGSHIHG